MKLGKKRQREKWYLFRAPTGVVIWYSPRGSWDPKPSLLGKMHALLSGQNLSSRVTHDAQLPQRWLSHCTCWMDVLRAPSACFRTHPLTAVISEVSKRGWRTEGVGARKSVICQKFRPLFCTLFPTPPYKKGEEFLENFLGSFWGFVCRQPLFETSDNSALVIGF